MALTAIIEAHGGPEQFKLVDLDVGEPGKCILTGLHTLKIKETDRLEALHTELSKLGATIFVSDEDLTLAPSTKIKSGVAIDTYNDHRMAMAFGPLALKTTILINDAEVVSKSYPDYWSDLKKLEILIKEL
jgi:3-phosphoshikimate 1-carboxyvinyltransferase